MDGKEKQGLTKERKERYTFIEKENKCSCLLGGRTMSERSIYLRLMAEMYLRGMDSHMLAEKTGIHYGTLRRKFRGQSPLLLDEALRIKEVLQCDLPLEKLFERRGVAA